MCGGVLLGEPLMTSVEAMNGRGGTVHEVEQDTLTEKQVDTVDFNSFSLNSIWSVIIANLKTTYSLNKVQSYSTKSMPAMMAI